MIKTFNELWEKCESYHQSINNDDNIINELQLKLDLYNKISDTSNLPEDEKKNAKSRLLGEILFTFTKLSLKDDINVFEALYTSLQYHLT